MLLKIPGYELLLKQILFLFRTYYAHGEECADVEDCVFNPQRCVLSVDESGAHVCTPASKYCKNAPPFALMVEKVARAIDVCHFQFSRLDSSPDPLEGSKSLLKQIHELKTGKELEEMTNSVMENIALRQVLQKHVSDNERLQLDGSTFGLPQIDSILLRPPDSIAMDDEVAYGNSKMSENMLAKTREGDALRKMLLDDYPGLIDADSGFIVREVRLLRALYCVQALVFELQSVYKQFGADKHVNCLFGGIWINDKKQVTFPEFGDSSTIVEEMREAETLRNQISEIVNAQPFDEEALKEHRKRFGIAFFKAAVIEKAIGGSSMALMGLLMLEELSTADQKEENALIYYIRANDAYKHKGGQPSNQMLLSSFPSHGFSDHKKSNSTSTMLYNQSFSANMLHMLQSVDSLFSANEKSTWMWE